MNKTKLEVIRINEDVIVTSNVVCNYSIPNGAMLFKSGSTTLVGTTNTNVPIVESHMKFGDSWNHPQLDQLTIKNSSEITIQENHWYHFDVSNITECPNSESHNYND